MITDAIVSILEKLKDNIERYEVTCRIPEKDKSCIIVSYTEFNMLGEVNYVKDSLPYSIVIQEDKATFSNMKMGRIEIPYCCENDKYRILMLLNEIKNNIEQCLFEQLNDFALASDDEID